jgi:hypothetical protein
MTSNTKILKQTIELLTGELKQVGEYRDNAVRCGVELNKQLAAMTAAKEIAERQVAVLAGRIAACNPHCPQDRSVDECMANKCSDCWAAWSRAEAEGGKG